MSMARRLALPPLGTGPVAFAVALGALLPILIAVVALTQVRSGELSPVLLLVIQGVIAISVLAVLLPLWRREAVLDGERLRVKATFYTREATLSEFDLDAARVVDLREHKQYKPWIKTNAYAVPGLWAGNFWMRDRRRAFCLVTDPSRVLVLPHADGRLWLLSLEHPQAVLEALRKAAG